MFIPVHNLSTGVQVRVEVEDHVESLHSESLQKAIHTALGTSPHLQRLFIAGAELLETKPLALNENTVVQLVIRSAPVPYPQPIVILTAPSDPFSTFNDTQVVYATAGPWGEEASARDQLLSTMPSLTRRQADKLVHVHWHACLVKILAIIDMLFLFTWSFIAWPFLFGFFASVCGYVGASHYKPSLVFIYFLWDCIQMSARIYWLIDHNRSTDYVVLTVICLVIELWLAAVVLRLFSILTRVSSQDAYVLENVLDRDYTFWTGPVHVRLIETQPLIPEKSSSIASSTTINMQSSHDG
jgi:hypothetical protein